jgi:GNAT superfamily N-acetyltransferase
MAGPWQAPAEDFTSCGMITGSARDNGLRIRRASLGDIATLVELSASTFRDTYASAHEPAEVERHIALNFTPAQIALEISGPASSVLLACVADEPVGYAALRIGPYPDCIPGPAPIELGRLYLTKESIGKGYGSALMRACLDEQARLGCGTIWLGVWDRNALACAFYEKWGFRRVGTYEFLFGDTPYRDVVMVRGAGRSARV